MLPSPRRVREHYIVLKIRALIIALIIYVALILLLLFSFRTSKKEIALIIRKSNFKGNSLLLFSPQKIITKKRNQNTNKVAKKINLKEEITKPPLKKKQ